MQQQQQQQQQLKFNLRCHLESTEEMYHKSIITNLIERGWCDAMADRAKKL